MGAIPKQLQDFMAKHSVAKDEVWEVRNGAYAIKHFAIERISAKAGIKFERPAILEHDASGSVSMIVFGKLGEREEWSTGEASPKNNKNAYPYAMAEKRAKGRVALKLLLAIDSVDAPLYSEEEAEDFRQDKRENPHVTRPEDILPKTEFGSNGQPIDNIPLADPGAGRKLTVKDQRPIFEALQKEIHATGSIIELQEWAETNKNRLADLKPDWQEMLRGVYSEQINGLRELARGDDMRMAG